MGKKIDLKNQRRGKMVAVRECGRSKHGKALWLCRCDCGGERLIEAGAFNAGQRTSCGCVSAEMTSQRTKTHGKTGHPLYWVWRGVINRCYDKNYQAYKHYGERGIKMCSEWRYDFQSFYDHFIALGYRKGLTVERKDNDGDYTPENCILADMIAQGRNQRLHSNNKTGVPGVTITKNGTYMARIVVVNKPIYLGTYKTLEEAAEARRQGEIKYWSKDA